MSTAYYRAEETEKAAIAFERFLFVNTEKGFTKDKAELLLGVCYEKMKQYDRAINFYRQVIQDNKASRYRPTIRDRMRNIEKKIEKQKTPEDKRL
jgi:tetratricopeptide (TPR) repeat protein